jgi:hypothetical protein
MTKTRWIQILVLATSAISCAPVTTQMEACPANGCHKNEQQQQPDAPPMPSNKLRAQAAFDLQCGKDQLQFTAIGEQHWYAGIRSWGVRGCEKQASYVVTPHDCAVGSDACNWVLNSPIQKTQ